MAKQSRNNQQQGAPPPGFRQDVEVPFPVGGVSNDTSHKKETFNTTFNAKNVLVTDSEELRSRGGRRPGLVKSTLVPLSKRVRLIDTINRVASNVAGYVGGFAEYIGNYAGRLASLPLLIGDIDGDPSTDDAVPDQGSLFLNMEPEVFESTSYYPEPTEANWSAAPSGLLLRPTGGTNSPSPRHASHWIARKTDGGNLFCAVPPVCLFDSYAFLGDLISSSGGGWDQSNENYESGWRDTDRNRPSFVWLALEANGGYGRAYEGDGAITPPWILCKARNKTVFPETEPSDRPRNLFAGAYLDSDSGEYLPNRYMSYWTALWLNQSENDSAFNSDLNKKWVCSFSVRPESNGAMPELVDLNNARQVIRYQCHGQECKRCDYTGGVAVVNSSTNEQNTDVKGVEFRLGYDEKCNSFKYYGIILAANVSTAGEAAEFKIYDSDTSLASPALFIGVYHKNGNSGSGLFSPSNNNGYGNSNSFPTEEHPPKLVVGKIERRDYGVFGVVDDLGDIRELKHLEGPNENEPIRVDQYDSNFDVVPPDLTTDDGNRPYPQDPFYNFNVVYDGSRISISVNGQNARIGNDDSLLLYANDGTNSGYLETTTDGDTVDPDVDDGVLNQSRRYCGLTYKHQKTLHYNDNKTHIALLDANGSVLKTIYPDQDDNELEGEITVNFGGVPHHLYFNEQLDLGSQTGDAGPSESLSWEVSCPSIQDSYPHTFSQATEESPSSGRWGFFRGSGQSETFTVGEWQRCKYFRQLGFKAELGGDWLRTTYPAFFQDVSWRTYNETGEGLPITVAVSGNYLYASEDNAYYSVASGEMADSTRPELSASNCVRVQGVPFFDQYFLLAGFPYVYTPSDNSVVRWDSSLENPVDFPGRSNYKYPTLISKYLSRLVMAGKPDEPNNWFMSATGDANSWDTGGDGANPDEPVAGNSSRLAEIGDPIRAIFPMHDTRFMFGCSDSIYMITDDPGSPDVQFVTVSRDIGVVGADAYCFGVNRVLYFFGQDGLYRMAPNENDVSQYGRISLGRFDREFSQIDHATNNIVLIYDHVLFGVHVLLCPAESPAADTKHYFYDERNDSFWPMEYPASMSPSAAMFYNSSRQDLRGILLGGFDSHIYKYDFAAQSDSGTPINSHVWLGPFAIDSVTEAKLVRMAAILDKDSSAVNYEIYVAETVEEAKSSTPVISSIWGSGRNEWKYERARGASIYVKVYQSGVIAKPWALESIMATLTVAGQARVRS
jgi:hypothetical protein